MNREIESIAMRPLAKDLTRSLEEVRNITRDQALRDLNLYTDRMRDALRHFDSLFAEFELRYGVKKKKNDSAFDNCISTIHVEGFVGLRLPESPPTKTVENVLAFNFTCLLLPVMCQPWCL